MAESLGALDIELTADDLAAIDEVVPRGAVVRARSPEAGMASLDSQR